MAYTDLNLDFATCCGTLLTLPNSGKLVLDFVHIVSMCQVLHNKAFDEFPDDLQPNTVLADYILVCNTTGVTLPQVMQTIRQLNNKYLSLMQDVCHELRIPSFRNAWELEKCVRANPTKASWPVSAEQRLEACVRIIDAHFRAVPDAANNITGHSAQVRACLVFLLMQPHDMAVSQVLLKLRRKRMITAMPADPILQFEPPRWLPDATIAGRASTGTQSQQHDGNVPGEDAHLVLLPPGETAMPAPSYKQYTLEEATIAYQDVLQDGLKHNCSSCLECRSHRQLKPMTLKKFAKLPVNWVDRMVPSTAAMGSHELHANIDRSFIHHLCQQAGHHAELIPEPSVASILDYRRKLTGPEYSCQGTMQQFHTSLRFCSTCHNYLTRPQYAMPPRSVMNGACLPALPEQIAAMTEVNERLLSIHQAFAEIRHLPRGGQHQVTGSVVHVESDLHALHHNSLPRTQDVLLVRVKRNLRYAGHSLARYCDMQTVRRQMRYLKNTPLYQDALLQGLDEALRSLIQDEGGIDMNDHSLKSGERHANDVISDAHMNSQHEQSTGNANSTNQGSEVGNESQHKHSADDDEIQQTHQHGTPVQCDEQDSGTESHSDDDQVRPDPAYGEKYPTEVLIDHEIPPHVLPALIRNGYNELSVAPCANNTPMGVLFDPNGAEKCFVHAYCGEKMTTNAERSVKLSYQELNKHLLALMDKRVAQRSSHIFFVLRRLQLLKVINETRVRIRQCTNTAYTAAQVKTDEGKQRLEREGAAQKMLSSVRTTPAYMQDARNKAHAMLRQLGTPTWFYTLTCRGHRQKELVATLYELFHKQPLTEDQYSKLTFHDVTHLMQKDAPTCARTFNDQLDAYIKYVMVGCKDAFGGVCDYFMMTEYQKRGDAHVHGIAWVPNAPKFGVNTHEEIVKFIDSYLTCDFHGAPPEVISAQIHKHTETCRKNKRRTCRFFFPKYPMPKTCILLPLKDEEMTCTEREVCHRNYTKISNELKNLYEGTKSHGLRNTQDTRTFVEFLAHLQLSEEEYMTAIRSSLTAPSVFLKRNMCDIFVNQYSRHGLSILGSNMDLQFILDPYAAVKYITSYMCKAQRGVSELLDRICEQQDDTITEKIKSLGRAFIKGTSVCAQEAVNLIMGNNIMRSSRDCIFIPTGTPDKRTRILKANAHLEGLEDDDTNIFMQGLLERYSAKPTSMQDICLAEFASMWEPVYTSRQHKKQPRDEIDPHGLERDDADIDPDLPPETQYIQEDTTRRTEHVADSGLKYRKRQFPKIIRYVNSPLRLDAEMHYREQCMLYVPWENEETMKPESSPTWEHWYNQNSILIQARHAQYECMKMDNIEAAAKQADLELQIYGDVQIVPTKKSQFLTELAVLEALGLQDDVKDSTTGLRIHTTQPIAKISRSPGRIDDNSYYEQVARLNYEQRAYLNHILHHCRNADPVQVIEFLSGGAGVGKSVLIHALVQTIIRAVSSHDPQNEHEVDKPVVLTAAPTGTAAFGIKGQTLHSMFHLRPGTTIMEDLSQTSWQALHNNFSRLKWLIIDEISLVQRGLLEIIDSRLQHIMANTLPFGGVNVVFVGDLFQLRPAGGAWIFADKSQTDSRKLGGNLWKEHVKMFELHTIMRQKESAEFAEILNRIRMGVHTQDDVDKLSALAVSEAHPTTPQLCSTHALCDAANQQAYGRAKAVNPNMVEATIHAENTSSTTMAYANKIIAEQEAAQQAHLGNLRQELLLYSGQTVELTTNINNDDGLTNGASGVIDHITWLPGSSQETRPHVVWISFHEPERGVKQRQKYQTLKTKLDASIPESSVPIFVVSKQDTSKCVGITRTQFPLSPAHARTIHHVQGVTIHGMGYINWGNWNPGGLLYVALSRFTEMNNITLAHAITHKHIKVDVQARAEVDRLRRDENRVQLDVTPIREARITHFKETGKHLFVALTHNVRSLKKHWRLIASDYDLPMCDVMTFQETRINASCNLDNYALPDCSLIHDPTMNAMKNPHGTCTYVRNTHECTDIPLRTQLPEGMYVQAFRIGPSTSALLHVNVYRSPSQCTTKQFITCLSEILEQHAKSYTYIICCGDFNIDVELPAYQNLMQIMVAYKMLNVVAFSTHNDGGVLDHIWTNIPTSECRCHISASPFSDHRPVWLAWESCPWSLPWTLPPSLHRKMQPVSTTQNHVPAKDKRGVRTNHLLMHTDRETGQNLIPKKRHLLLPSSASNKAQKATSHTSPSARLLIKRQFYTDNLPNVITSYVPPFLPIQGVQKQEYDLVAKLKEGEIDWAKTGFFSDNTWLELGGIACGEFLDMQMLMSLTNNNLLCGSMLSLCLTDIAQQCTAAGEKTWVMSCTWSTHLLGSNLQQFHRQECLDGMLRNRDIDPQQTPTHVLIPVCRNNQHYYLVYMNLLSRTTWVIDSCAPIHQEVHSVGSNLQSFLDAVWPPATNKPWSRSVAKCTPQSNGTECGIHCIVNAACMLSGKPLDYPESHLKHARHAIYTRMQSIVQSVQANT